MSERGVVDLERDVVAARERLMGDIAALRAPGGLTDLPETIRQAAIGKKDDIVEDLKDRGRGFVEAAREKAVANPAATLVIGAGLAWHFLRRPPIAAALIGGGLLSLLRTRADGAAGGTPDDALQRARQNLRRQAGDLGASVGGAARHAMQNAVETSEEIAGEARAKAAGLAADLKDRAADMADDARRRAASIAGTARERAGEIADAARQAIADTPLGGLVQDEDRMLAEPPFPDDYPGETDEGASSARRPVRTETVLIGAAGVALGAVIAALYQRRNG